MTFKYNNVYINGTSTVVGPYEAKGPLSKLYDKSYKDFYEDILFYIVAYFTMHDELISNIESSLTSNEYEVFILLIRGLNYKE